LSDTTVEALVRLTNSVNGTKLSGYCYEGSHLCHKSVRTGIHCRSIFCMIWESCINNGRRKHCHERFTKLQEQSEDGGESEDGEDGRAPEMECACVPGITIPCKARAHETRETVRNAAIDTFKAVQREPHPETNGKRANRYGRCPFPDCRREIVTTIYSLDDRFTDAHLGALVRHMNREHGTKLGVLTWWRHGREQECYFGKGDGSVCEG
jgi:hypothetical protein